ncbi:MAG: molybdopterin-guanine dinucleotide biosynthesis protein B [Planctomycetaceae bacterium]|nr:molybdopterin-guanine dinucleotide biosynthesis protein B [Planctomycetaceae bacterium]
MKRIHIVGRKNSGKTTLIVELVEHLTQMGYRVGTVKHTHHRHELDTPGKDSYRHRQAGAVAVGILSPEMNAVFWPAASDETTSNRYDELAPVLDQCDIVLVEGHSQTEGPKIEVWRAVASDEPIAVSDPLIQAVVSDDATEVKVPVWSRTDVPAIAARVCELARN